MDEQNKNEREIPVICQRIRYYREKKQMEQKALARELGIISNAVSNWENGRAKPPVSSLPQISQILGVTIEELFGMPAPAPSEETKPGIRMTTRKITSIDDALLEKFHGLNKLHQSFVDSLLDRLTELEDEELYNSISEEQKAQKQLCAGYDPGLEFDDIWDTIHLYKEKLDPRMDCIFPVSGDSMEPDFHNGDLVMVQRVPGNTTLEQGEIGAFICGNETYIKVYTRGGLRSLNKKYKMMRFTDEERVFIIGRVLGVLPPDAIVDRDVIIRYERAKKRIEERGENDNKDNKE